MSNIPPPVRRPGAGAIPFRETLIRSPIAARIEDEVRVTAADFIEHLSDIRRKTAVVRYKIEGDVRSGADEVRDRVKRVTAKARTKLGDEAKFLKSWIDSPGKTGAVTPSGPFLARRMASYVDVSLPGPVIEIGPGTGPVTEALIEHGVSEDRLVLVEFSPEFCALLRQRFPKARVIEGDAYDLRTTLAGQIPELAAAVVSSLPLFNQPPHKRKIFADEVFALLHPGSPLIQFTYAMTSPLPRKQPGLTATVSDWVLRNIPPARVWVYRRR